MRPRWVQAPSWLRQVSRAQDGRRRVALMVNWGTVAEGIAGLAGICGAAGGIYRYWQGHATRVRVRVATQVQVVPGVRICVVNFSGFDVTVYDIAIVQQVSRWSRGGATIVSQFADPRPPQTVHGGAGERTFFLPSAHILGSGGRPPGRSVGTVHEVRVQIRIRSGKWIPSRGCKIK